ncbi:unnamed protein product [Mytilus coruscus]|uniref:Uncharacterized protein n=1 Tax=Mytilus coruscus TaxID=42192 RepID=A0A6J8B362_MYTCO|nr:unnamed protein product [Mytilus coruscus]
MANPSQNENEEFKEASNEPIPSISAETQSNKRKRIYEEEKADEPTHTDGPQRIQEKNVPSFRAFRKLNVKLVRCQQHHMYLNKCKNKDTIPKTLRVNIKPQVPDTTPRFLIKWETAHIEFSRTLVGLLQEYWKERCENIKTQISDMAEDLNTNTEPAEMELITNLIERTKISVEEEIQNPKKNT